MAEAATLERPVSLVATVLENPVTVLTDAQRFDRFYEEMKRETDALVPDVSTRKGREEIASMAYKVARTKTAIDEAGKRLNEDARAKIAVVDEARRKIRTQLDALKDEVRHPLTEWEAAEEERVARVERSFTDVRQAAIVEHGDTAALVLLRLEVLRQAEVDPALYQEREEEARDTLASAIASLEAAHARLVQEEADRAELARLRAEAAERAERERQEAEAAAAREREAAAARAREEAAARAEAEQAARVAAAAEAAERAAVEAAERRAREAHEAQEREHAQALAAERRRADEAEAARRAAAEAAAAAERRRQEEAAAAQAEEDRRARDRKHKAAILGTAKAAIMHAGAVDEETARKIVLAIQGGHVPAVTLKF